MTMLEVNLHPQIINIISCVRAKSLQSYSILCSLTDYSRLGSSVHGILQTRILEWVPCPPPDDLPNLGIKPVPARHGLAGQEGRVFFSFFKVGFLKTFKTKVDILWPPQWLSRKESACNAGDSGEAGSSP